MSVDFAHIGHSEVREQIHRDDCGDRGGANGGGGRTDADCDQTALIGGTRHECEYASGAPRALLYFQRRTEDNCACWG